MYAKDKFELPLQEAPVFTPDLDDVGKLLMRAAQTIRELGWCQGNFEKDDGRVCLVRSITALRPFHMPTVEAALNKLNEHLGGTPISFNDAPGRTATEVIAALESAALRSGEAR